MSTEHEHHGPNGRIVRHNHENGGTEHYHGADAPPAWRYVAPDINAPERVAARRAMFEGFGWTR